MMKLVRMFLVMASALLAMSPTFVWSQVDDFTHESDHLEDERVEVLETVHVHGLRLNKDQQRRSGPQVHPVAHHAAGVTKPGSR